MTQINLTQNPDNLPGFRMSWTPNPFPHIITEDGERLDLRHVRFDAVGSGPTLNEQGEVEYDIGHAVSESEDATPDECEIHSVLRGFATPERVAQIATDLRIVTIMYRMEREVRKATPPDLVATDVRDDLEKALAGAAPDGYGYGSADRYAEALEKEAAYTAETEAAIWERIEGSADLKDARLAIIQETLDALPAPRVPTTLVLSPKRSLNLDECDLMPRWQRDGFTTLPREERFEIEPGTEIWFTLRDDRRKQRVLKRTVDSNEEAALLRRNLRWALQHLNGTRERITVADVEDKMRELESVPYGDDDPNPRPTFR